MHIPHDFHQNFLLIYESVDRVNATMGNNTTCKVIGVGSVKMRMFDGMVRTLTNVRHVLGLKKNLISLGTFDKIECRITCEGGVMKNARGSLVVMKGKMNGSLYDIEGSTISISANISTNTMSDQETKLWHLRLGHMGERGMYELSKQGLFDGKKLGNLGFCEQRVYGKHKRVSFKPAIHNTKGILDYIHSLLRAPSRKPSLSGCNYFLTFIDDFSRKVWCYFIKH